MSAAITANESGGRSPFRLWRDILGLLKELWLAHPVACLATVTLLIIGNVRVGLYVTAAGGVVSALIGEPAGGHSALFWLGAYVLASALEEFHWTVSPVVSTYLRDHGTFRMQERVLRQAAAAPLIQFEEGEFFAHLQRASAAMGDRLLRVYAQLTGVVTEIVRVAALAVALYAVHPVLPLLPALSALPAIWLQTRVATALYQAQRAHTRGDRIRKHLEQLLTGREAAAEVRLFGAAGFLLGRWRRLRDERTRDVIGAERRLARSSAIADTCSGAGYAAALAFVALLILRGQLSIGNYVTVVTGALWFEGILGNLITSVRSMAEESRFLGDLFDFWRLAGDEGPAEGAPGRLGHEANGRPTPARSVPEMGQHLHLVRRAPLLPFASWPNRPGASLLPPIVEAEGLDFRFPDSPRPVLHDIDVRIGSGEKVAIVGENGAGKSTLVKLLIGLYQPNRGVVRLDGLALTPDRAVEARSRVAAVFQDYATFQLTVRENIGFGDLARLHDDRALAEAARRAGVDDLVGRRPGGLDAYLGREFGEADVSGGQWQRIALARAFFRDAGLLVLDEPTAALDPLAELALFARFAELVEGRTAIMISHRLGMAKLADRVLVLRDGTIVEEGRHDDLLARGGHYAGMFEAQAQWYR